ncbi:MAG TPA: ABC transporter permease [Tepidisphaeraceae bacterium]|nr:ABC transporter permease [Tepidisphaeraceae bacterium]
MTQNALNSVTMAGGRSGLMMRLLPMSQQLVVVVLLAIEIIIFSIVGRNFLTVENAFEVIRQNVEIGLLALALTPVIVAGGIDLSVGSLIALCAVVLGMSWQDWGLPLGVAVGVALLIGTAAGLLNGLLITRLGIAPLIVTLGSMSLFKGLAEGLMSGRAPFTHFSTWFNELGNRYLFGFLPEQVLIFVVAAIAFGLLLHRTTIGRTLVAIGFSFDGARYAGVPVCRRLLLVYCLSGLVAGLAAVIYVARVGEANAGAGRGYELYAITAVVLGGTSIFGGRGTVAGTLLALFAIGILRNGLRLADQPAELAGVLVGTLLIVAIIGNKLINQLTDLSAGRTLSIRRERGNPT